MLNSGFYPTPVDLIDRMVQPLLDEDRFLPGTILEPSAGKGDIVERLHKRYHKDKKHLYCIEKEVDLQLLLVEKGFPVIGTDFLTYEDHYSFRVILMNPPFDDGASHLLKAWSILEHGDIVCLLNAETIRNPYTEERQKLKQLIDIFGEVEEAGRPFARAERPTNVEVVIVRLHKESRASQFDLDADAFEQDFREKEAKFTESPLAHADLIDSLVSQYNRAVDVSRQLDKLYGEYHFYTKEVLDSKSPASRSQKEVMSLNDRIDELKGQFWNYIFTKTKLGSATTSNYQKKFTEVQSRTGRIAFNRANIMMVLETFLLNRDEIIQECIVSVFDQVTALHKDNIIHQEGWVTNKGWKLGKKIITPWGITYNGANSWYGGYGKEEFYRDLDKCMCFLSGKQMPEMGWKQDGTYGMINDGVVTISKAIDFHRDNVSRRLIRYDEKFESTFFRICIFKKGTVHLYFKDLDLLARFNIVAAQGKKWVGAGT